MYREETLLNVIKSVTRNGRSIILTAVLALILVYLFSIVGYLFFKDDFILEVDKLPNETLLPGWYWQLILTVLRKVMGFCSPGHAERLPTSVRYTGSLASLTDSFLPRTVFKWKKRYKTDWGKWAPNLLCKFYKMLHLLQYKERWGRRTSGDSTWASLYKLEVLPLHFLKQLRLSNSDNTYSLPQFNYKQALDRLWWGRLCTRAIQLCCGLLDLECLYWLLMVSLSFNITKINHRITEMFYRK